MKTKPTTTIQRISYTIPQLIDATGLSRNKIYKAIARGELRSFRDGKRRLVSHDAILEYIRLKERETE